MNIDEYQSQALVTENRALSYRDLQLKNALGLAGEAGEVLEQIKKVVFHGRELDHDALKKELGDVLWYVVALASVYGMKASEVAGENLDKLRRRYPDGVYSHAACSERKDEG